MVLLIAVMAASTAFAQPEFKISAGAGGFFDNDFVGSGVKASMSMPGYGSGSTKLETPYSGGGVYGFFDLTYAELSIGYFFGKVTFKQSEEMNALGITISESSDFKATAQGLNFGLLVKYPFNISDKFSIFPLLGIEYKAVLSLESEEGETANNPGDLSSFLIKVGVGGDISLTDSIYLRLNVLYGIKAPNKFENDMFDQLKSSGGSAETLNGHSLTAKLAVGFRF